MRPDEIKQKIDELNLAEKLLLIEDVWDSIAHGNEELPLQEWQKHELDKRYKEYMAGEQNLHDWQSVHEDIRNKYKSAHLGSPENF
jgi:putative addiction module component (TIGR02574 family)